MYFLKNIKMSARGTVPLLMNRMTEEEVLSLYLKNKKKSKGKAPDITPRALCSYILENKLTL